MAPATAKGGKSTANGNKERRGMQYSQEVENMCPVAKGAYHGPAPIPEEGKWVQAYRRFRTSPATPTVWAGAHPSRAPAS